MGNLMSCVLICGAMEVVQVVNTNGRVERLIRPIRAAELIWAHERYRAAALAAAATLHSNPALPPPPPPPPPPPRSSEEDKNNKNPSTQADSNPKFLLLPLDPSSAIEQRSSSEAVGCRSYKFQCHSEENVSVAAQSQPQQQPSKSSSSPKQQQQQQQHRSKNASPAATNPAPPSSRSGGGGGGSSHAPFRVKKEGGVTTLVVSKRYLEQLLAEKEMKAADAVAAADILQDHNYLPCKSSGGAAKHSRRSSRSCSGSSSSSSSSGRSGIWRPALESISESQNGYHLGGDQIVPGGHSHRSHHHHHHHHRHKQVKA